MDRQFGAGKFQSFEDLGIRIPSTAAAATDGTQDAYVRGYAISPPTMIPPTASCSPCRDRASPTGSCPTAPMTMAPASCMIPPPPPGPNKGAIVVNIHDRSSAGPGEYFDIYDFVVDDVNVMQYFIDTYGVTGNIVLQGNSRGTMASALVIKALAGQAYNPQNQKKDAGLEETSTLPEGKYDFTIDAISARMVPSVQLR